MERHFMKSLKALCTGVMTLCVASLSLTSCYDDSALNAKVDELGKEVSELDARLQAVEALTAKLEALTARVDALYTLKFQVTATNELQYSFDGGTTWVSTGIVLAKELECTCEVPEACKCVEVSLTDNGDSVTIKVGDQEFTIEKPEEIMFEIKAGKVYFDYEQTLSIGVKSVGIEDMTVMAAPKGWWAEITDDGKIEVTAPTEEDAAEVEIGIDQWGFPIYGPGKAAAEGYVKVHACGSDGKCKVGKFPVVVTKDGLAIVAYQGIAYIHSNNIDDMVAYGISTKKDYQKDAQTVISAINAGNRDGYANHLYWADEHPEGVSMADALGHELVKGEEYVIWALKFDQYANYQGIEYSVNDLVLSFYSLPEVLVKEDTENSNPWSIMIDLEVKGVESYLALATYSEYYDEYTLENFVAGLADYLESGSDWNLMGKVHNTAYSGPLSYICEGTNSSLTGNEKPNQTWYLLVLPLDGRPGTGYTVNDVVVNEFTSKGVENGGSVNAVAVEFSDESVNPYTELAVELTPPTGEWIYLYTNFLAPEDYTGKTDAQLVDLLLEGWGTPPEYIEGWKVFNTDLEPDTKCWFVAFFIDKSGKYGQLAKLELSTDNLVTSDIVIGEYTTNLVEGALKNEKTFTITVPTSKPASKFKYVNLENDWSNKYKNMEPDEVAQELAISESVNEVLATELVDQKIEISGLEYAKEYYFAVLPYDESEAPGTKATIVVYNTVFELSEVITDASAFVGEPTVTFVIPELKNGFGIPYYWFDSSYEYSVNYSVSPAAGTQVATLVTDPVSLTNDYDYDFNSRTSAKKASDLWTKSVIGQSYYTYITDSAIETEARSFFSNDGDVSPVIMVSWNDANGNYYYKEISLAQEFAIMKANLDHKNNGTVLTATNTPSGKQWTFFWDDMQTTMLIDLGVSLEDTFVFAYDVVSQGAPEGYPYQIYNKLEYSIIPAGETCGSILATSYDVVGEPISNYYPYFDLTESSCRFGFESLLGTAPVCELATGITVDTSGGVGGM